MEGLYPGRRACCAYREGRLYHLNAHGRVACLDAASGKELWAVDVLERFAGRNITWAMSECLLVDGPRLIVTPGGDKALMAALDKRDGRTLWTTEPLVGDRVSYCSPLLFRHAGRRLLAGCSAAQGFGVDAASGKLLWKVPLKSPYGVNVLTPVYGDGSIFYTTPYFYGACYRLQPTADGMQAEKAWDTTLDTCTGSVIFLDGLLYGSGYKKHKSWLAIDWKSGEIRHEFKGLTSGAAVYADGRLYCLAEDGRAALLRPTPRASRPPDNSVSWKRRSTTPGPIRSCLTAACISAITTRCGVTTCAARSESWNTTPNCSKPAGGSRRPTIPRRSARRGTGWPTSWPIILARPNGRKARCCRGAIRPRTCASPARCSIGPAM